MLRVADTLPLEERDLITASDTQVRRSAFENHRFRFTLRRDFVPTCSKNANLVERITEKEFKQLLPNKVFVFLSPSQARFAIASLLAPQDLTLKL